jgi:hypothetical protein
MAKCMFCGTEIKDGQELCAFCLSQQIVKKIPLLNIIPIPELDKEKVEEWLKESGWLDR